MSEARSVGDWQAWAAQLFSPEVLYLPIRHHSPACAWHIRQLIRSHKPWAVLIEGPHSFNALIPLLLERKTKPPIAIYSQCREALADGEWHSHAAYYPFAEYSPEWVALREGAEHGAQLAFIDLDYPAKVLLADAEPSEQDSQQAEHYLRHSQYLQALAQRCHCRDVEELWEQLFESRYRALSSEQFFAEVAVYCALGREGVSAESDQRQGNSGREQMMAAQIQHWLARRAEAGVSAPLLVVTGGYHTAVLPQLVAAHVSAPELDVSRYQNTGHYPIRYSYTRLDALNGYAAGMPAPQYWQSLWELRERNSATAQEQLCLQWLQRLAEEAKRRRFPQSISTALLSAAQEQALRLARLRGRSGPLRYDLLDAVESCLVQGESDAQGLLLRQLLHELLCGDALGELPITAPLPPLVDDVRRRVAAARLKLEDGRPKRLSLELYRRADHRQLSRILHALQLLAVPFARCVRGPDFVNGVGLERLREEWEYSWTPLVESALIEASRYGPTLPQAAATCLQERWRAAQQQGQAPSALLAVKLLTQACQIGLQQQLALLCEWLQACIAQEPQLPALAHALQQLLLLWQARLSLDARELEQLPQLLNQGWQRACFLFDGLNAQPEAERPAQAEALLILRDLIAGERQQLLDPELFWQVLEQQRQRAQLDPYLYGVVLGLLHAVQRCELSVLEHQLRGWLVGQGEQGIACLQGLFLSARALAWQAPSLLGSVDAFLRLCDEQQFLHLLPPLRLAFAGLTPGESDQVGRLVGAFCGGEAISTPVQDWAHVDWLEALQRQHAARAVLQRDGLGGWLHE